MAVAEMGSPEYEKRVQRGVKQSAARKRETLRINLPEIRHYRKEGLVSPSMLPLVKIAEDELRAIIQAMGGPECITEQERALAEDFARMGVVLRGELARYIGGEPKAGQLVGALASHRRNSPVALGLERRQKEIGLEDYIDARFKADTSSA